MRISSTPPHLHQRSRVGTTDLGDLPGIQPRPPGAPLEATASPKSLDGRAVITGLGLGQHSPPPHTHLPRRDRMRNLHRHPPVQGRDRGWEQTSAARWMLPSAWKKKMKKKKHHRDFFFLIIICCDFPNPQPEKRGRPFFFSSTTLLLRCALISQPG